MKLTTYIDGEQDAAIVTENADLPTVETVLQRMDWSSIAFLTLAKDDNNHCEGSGSTNDGFCLTLKEDSVEYVGETAPANPQAMLPAFEAYLDGDIDRVFRIIVDADRRGLTEQEVDDIRLTEANEQKGRMMREAIVEAAPLFSAKKYAEYVAKVAPFESLLGSMDQKKLTLARKKAQ